jgi:hypothetical protein
MLECEIDSISRPACAFYVNYGISSDISRALKLTLLPSPLFLFTLITISQTFFCLY